MASELTTDRLASMGFFFGGTYIDDPITPRQCWLLSDGAGNAVPVSSEEQGLIDLILQMDVAAAAATERVAALEVELGALQAALWAVRAKHAYCDGSGREFDLLQDVRQIALAALEPKG